MKKVENHYSISVLFLLTTLIFTVAAALVAFIPTSAVAYPGGCHYWAAQAATELFGVGFSHQTADPEEIDRNREVPLFPELEGSTKWYNPEEGCCDDDDVEWRYNWDWVRICAQKMDDLESDTRHHFWFPEEGLHECPNDVAGVNNAWEEIHSFWIGAISAWFGGNPGMAYAYLGYAIHFIEDMGQPAHTNEDMHPGDTWSDDDSLEDWISGQYCEDTFIWDELNLNLWPGPILYPPTDNAGILNTVLNSNGGYWDPDHDEPIEVDSDWEDHDKYFFDLSLQYSMFNKQQLFYIMYVVNQTANYFASDSEDGDTWEGIGWLGGYTDFPNCLHDEDENCVSAQNSDGLDPDNDGNDVFDDDDNNRDGDLGLIADWGYGTAFRAVPAVIDLFRRTVDNVPPVTTVELSRVDGEPLIEWNNSPVTVQLTGATDYGNYEGLRASGVWQVWGRCDGEPPADPNAPSWGISTEGIHTVECMSTDYCGNVEQDQDIIIKIDMTPPEITFPDLRPNYLTSENFIATWVATDALSGVASEIAYLDGAKVNKGQVIDLALMAGLHTLRVIAADYANNWRDVEYSFEVFIDAESWAKSVNVNNKTKGNAMYTIVEFPMPYDVGIIDMTTCTLAVGAAIDLTANDPVVGGSAILQADLVTGVGDHDEDGIPDRMLRFNKEQFVAALGDQVGDIPAVLRGGLLPDGLPEFLGVAIVPVFDTPRKK